MQGLIFFEYFYGRFFIDYNIFPLCYDIIK